MNLKACYITETKYGEYLITHFDNLSKDPQSGIILGEEKGGLSSPGFLKTTLDRGCVTTGYKLFSVMERNAIIRGIHIHNLSDTRCTTFRGNSRYITLKNLSDCVYMDNVHQNMWGTWVVGEDNIKKYFEDNIHLLL